MQTARAATAPLLPTVGNRAIFLLACLAMGAATLAILAGAYIVKRRLGIDVFPRFNMLPDFQIEAVIRAVVRLVLG